jgi:phosphomannomutase
MRYLKLGTAGMRGVVGNGIEPLRVIDYAAAFGTFVDGGRVVVGRDSRASSLMIYHAVVAALMNCGCQVIDAGITPAPVLHFMTEKLEADGALLIGAGHQGAGWNAVIPLNGNGSYMNSVMLQELLDVYHSRQYRCVTWDKLGHLIGPAIDPTKHYLELIAAQLDLDLIRQKKYRVVADFCNGSGIQLIEQFSELLGIEMIPINRLESGLLPHSPEPCPRSAAQAQSIMAPLNADIGFVFNSDMSRCSVVTDCGETLSEEYTFPLVADYMLSRKTNNRPIVTNICTTRTLDEIVQRHGGVLYKTRVGQGFLIDKMMEVNALLAGDGSGSTAFSQGVNGFDSFMQMAMILEAMAHGNISSSELAERLPRYHAVKMTVPCRSERAYKLLKTVKSYFPDATVSEIDGLNFEWDDGWISLRAATTEPMIRMISEWSTHDEAFDRAMQLRGLLERLE